MTKVKICGITNLEDAMDAASLGADYLGFNFYPKSPRHIKKSEAKKIISSLPKNIKKVGVFVNEGIDKVKSIVNEANLDLIQLHGDETPYYCAQLKNKGKKTIIKAFRIKNYGEIKKTGDYDVDYLMFDAFRKGMFGGTGKTFDWKIVKEIKRPFFLSGGLNADNIKGAIKAAKPFAVDVASSVEKKPGKKDYRKMKSFIEAAK